VSSVGGVLSHYVTMEVIRLVPGGGLLAHEVAGGHTLAKHVGKTEEFLRYRLATGREIRAASTFYDRDTAEASLSGFIDSKAEEITSWLSGYSDDLVLNGSGARPLGFVISKKTAGRSECAGIRLVLRRSSGMPMGYRIHTAMVTK
jgi:Bacterial CdiA-CT RNAse A domain